MEDNMHEVVKLLLARMKSHPEEFAAGSSRWGWMVTDAMESGSDEERAALKAGLRPIRLQEVHEFVLDELCNGEERRRKEQEEYERTAWTALGAGSMGASLRNAITPALQRIDERTYAQQLNQLGHPGQFITDYATQTMRVKDTHTGAVTAVSREQIEAKGFVATMKKVLGI